MEENILITKEELGYLRSKLIAQYDISDKENNGNMELNTHKKNYIFLAKKMTDLIKDQRKYGNAYAYKNIGTSQLLAFIHDTNQGHPKAFLIEACYQYIYGEKRKHFFQSKEGKNLLESWKNATSQDITVVDFSKNDVKKQDILTTSEEAQSSVFIEADDVKKDAVFLPKEVEAITSNDLKDNPVLVQSEETEAIEFIPQTEIKEDKKLFSLEKIDKTINIQPFWLRHIRTIGLVIGVILCFNSYLVYKYYNKYQLEHLWAMPSIEEEMLLKNRMTFVEDAAFQQVVLACIHLIEADYDNLSKGVIKSNISNELIYYKNEKNSEELKLMSYHFYTGFASWWSTDRLTQGLQDTVHTLFDNLVDSSFIKAKNQSVHNPKDPFYITRFLKIDPSVFLPVSLFAVFKNSSTEVMLRYPPFKEDKNHLDKYVLKNRQWFTDAYGNDKYTVDRNSKIQWTFKNSKGQTIPVGLSKPFLSVRTGTPLHRVLWFKIPTQSKDSLLFCVNMILNNN
jgi:hypothetical protein